MNSRKLFTYLTAVLFIVAMSAVPAMAEKSNDINSINNNGIVGNHNHHATVVSGNVVSGGNAYAAGGNVNNSGNSHVNVHNNVHNTNLNSNHQTQGQIQGQVQGQTQTAEGGAGGNAVGLNVEGDVTIIEGGTDTTTREISNSYIESNSTIEHKGMRGFANQIEMTYPGLANYFGEAENDGNIQSVKTILLYKNVFTRADVEALLKGVDASASRTVPEIDEKTDEDTVTVILEPVSKSLVKRQCAVITSKATSKKASSINALAGAILEALDVGADVLIITAEGAGQRVSSFGWGVGLAYTHAVISTTERSSGVGSGGTGFSGGSAGYEFFPWVQGIALELNE